MDYEYFLVAQSKGLDERDLSLGVLDEFAASAFVFVH